MIILRWSGFICLLILCFHCHAQDGPGGIGNKSGTSNLKVWLNADAIEGVSDGNNLTTWPDISGNGIDAIQNTVINKPNFQKSFRNGFSVVSFEGTREYMDGTYGSLFQAPMSVFTVGYYSDINQLADDNDYLFSVGNTSAAGFNRMSVGRAKSNSGAGNADRFINTHTDAVLLYGDVITGTQWVISSQLFNASAPYHTAYLNGTQMAMSGDYSSPLQNEGNFSLGRYRNGGAIDAGNLLKGSIGEIIIYDKVVNDAERKLITAYLGAKYNQIIAGDIYNGDANANGDNDRDVAGVGTESNGSNTIAYSASLTSVINSNFEIGDYLVMGHNVLTNTVNTTDPDLGSFQGRWERSWYFDVTDQGSPLTVDLSFDLSDSGFGGMLANASNYKLLFRSGASGAWMDTGATATIVGDNVKFINTPLTNGDGFYTLATLDISTSPIGVVALSNGNDGPGGVGSVNGSSSLRLWLDANKITGSNNDAVITWEDRSGYGHHALSAGTAFPLLKYGNALSNNNKFINFNNTNSTTAFVWFSGSLSNLSAPATIIAIPYFEQVNQASGDRDYVIRIGDQATNNAHTSITRGKSGGISPSNNNYNAWDGSGTIKEGVSLPGQSWMILSQVLNSSSPFHDLFLNGARNAPTNFSGTINTNGNYELGKYAGTFNPLYGNLAEVIVYDKALNAAEINIVHAYLAAKYNLSLDASGHGDKYTGDDLANGDYDLDVVGIGQSAAISGAAAGTNASAHSAGLTLTINSNFGDGDFVMTGHKTAVNGVNVIDIASDDPLLQARWERIWYFDVTDAGAILSVNITFDFSNAGFYAAFAGGLASNYKLLYRSSQSGAWTVVATGSSYNADQLTFSGLSLPSDGYFTVGTVDLDASPLPVELISFNAVKNKLGISLSWVTASEKNMDVFIVERSFNGLDYDEIGSVEAIGDLNKTNYHLLDNESIGSSIYYRLQMVDKDGHIEYSEIIKISNEPSVIFYPNPAKNEISVITSTEEGAILEVIDEFGKLIMRKTLDPNLSKKYIIDTDAIKPGVYWVNIIERNKRKAVKMIKIY
ncbi:MAG: T9SS type A sorting domain-containing protein [Chitinophagales bacterium]